MIKKILTTSDNKQWLWVLPVFGLVLSLIVWVPQLQVASLKESVDSLRRNNPKAIQKIINAEKARLDAETAARVALVQGIGLILITGYFSLLNYNSSRSKQMDERFNNALAQLQSDDVNVRLSGVLTLKQHAKNEKYRTRQIMDILADHVRKRSPWIKTPRVVSMQEIDDLWNDKPVRGELIEVRPSQDIQAAMDVIAFSECNYKDITERHVDLSGTDLRGLRLRSGASLRRVNLLGANLEGAELPETDFRDAILVLAKVRLANLKKAKFQNANCMYAEFEQVSAEGAEFQGANLVNLNLNGAKLKKAKFQNADCTRAEFIGANLEGANFQDAILDSAWFTEAKGITLDQIRQAKSYKEAVDMDRKLISDSESEPQP